MKGNCSVNDLKSILNTISVKTWQVLCSDLFFFLLFAYQLPVQRAWQLSPQKDSRGQSKFLLKNGLEKEKHFRPPLILISWRKQDKTSWVISSNQCAVTKKNAWIYGTFSILEVQCMKKLKNYIGTKLMGVKY